jgi:hypothetical protein
LAGCERLQLQSYPLFFTVSDSSVVTWSKDGQVVSADSFKVIQDERLGKQYFPIFDPDCKQTIHVSDTDVLPQPYSYENNIESKKGS